MKKAKVLIALMLIISLVFPSAGMAAGSIKDTSSTKEVSGKPEIKILECQWLSRDDLESPWKKLDGTYDFAENEDEYIEFKNEIKISSNQKLEGDIALNYSFGDEENTSYVEYNIESTKDQYTYLLTAKTESSTIDLNKYNNDKGLAGDKVYRAVSLSYSNSEYMYDYNLDELLLDQSNNPTGLKMLNMVDDFDAPVLKNISVTKPTGELQASDNIQIEAEVEENVSGLSYVRIEFDQKFDKISSDTHIKQHYIYLEHMGGNTYVYDGPAFDEKYPPNRLEFKNVELKDVADNYRYYASKASPENDIEKLPCEIDLDMSFADGNGVEDRVDPTLKNIKITTNTGEEKYTINEGDWPLHVSAEAEDDMSGVDYIDVSYINDETGDGWYSTLTGEGTMFSSEEENYRWVYDGEYRLDEIEVYDKAGNCSTYTYSGVDEWGEPCKKLDKNIDLTFNTDKPVLKDIKITDANGNEKYTFDENDEYYNIEALAEDKGSGVEYIEVYYTSSKSGEIETFDLYERDGKFKAKEWLDIQPKKYTLNKIVIYDNYGNETTYTYTGVDENGEKCEKVPNGKNIDINFKNGNDENIAPTLEFYKLDSSNIEAPGTLKGTIKASDNESDFIYVYISYVNVKDEADELYIDDIIENNKESEFTYDFDKFYENGKYKLHHIRLEDENDNDVYYGNLEDLSDYVGEHREFNENIDQNAINVKSTIYADFINLNELYNADKITKYGENSKIYVTAEFGSKITTKMLQNIKKANKNVEFVFNIVDNGEVEGFCDKFIFNSNSITDEYINSLSGRSIYLDMQSYEEYDDTFYEDVIRNTVSEEAWDSLNRNWMFNGESNVEEWSKQARNIFVKSGCEQLIPFIENYASKQNVSFYNAAEKLRSESFEVLTTGSNDNIRFPDGSRFEISNDYHYDIFMENIPYKVWHAGDDLNNLKSYESSSLNIFKDSVIIEEPGKYYISKLSLGYNDAKVDISDAKVTGITDSYFTGGAITQNVIVNCGTRNLVKDRDYKVTYENNVNAGTAKVIITGMGAYKGQIVKTFTISKKASTLNVPTSIFNKTYGNSRFNLGVSSNTAVSYVSSNSSVASVDQSGSVTIKGVGIANITVTALGDGNFTPVQKSVVISVGKGTASVKASNYKKTRSSKKFKVKASSTSGGKLTYSSSNKKVATVSKGGYVTIKGIGKTTITIKSAATSKYNASYKKITVQVVPKTMKINKVKAGKKSVKVYWSKDKYVSGYQVVIAKDKKFKKGKKTYKISKNKYTSKNISKLSKKKYYYVKMRSYKKVGRTYYYSNYSKIKRIKTK